MYVALPTTGKMSCGTFGATASDDAYAARRPCRQGHREENEKSSGCRPVACHELRFALEGPEGNTGIRLRLGFAPWG
jgi:hypothetical protein